jgi:hypothetical protein
VVGAVVDHLVELGVPVQQVADLGIHGPMVRTGCDRQPAQSVKFTRS